MVYQSPKTHFNKYKDFLKDELHLSTTERDLSFHYKRDEKTNQLQCTMAVFVDDTLASGELRFEKLTEKITPTF